MALKGTLEDFGIAEILQLIGQQAKSGTLHVFGGDDEVHVHFADGAIVSAVEAGRKQRDRLGAMLVRAGLVSHADVERALEAQRRTLRRLGDLLVEMELISRAELREMTALQTTETVYRLFAWRTGTYAFEAGSVEWNRDAVTPLQADAVLMEGFRRMDEWPMVRRTISSLAMTFTRSGGADRAERGEDAPSLGPPERRVLALATAGRTVEEIVDRSRLGEFETCKALLTLVQAGFLWPQAPLRDTPGRRAVSFAQGWRERLRRTTAGLAATIALGAVLAGGAWWTAERNASRARDGAPRALDERGARRFLGRYALSRLAGALEVYRLEHGDYPDRLDALVEAGLVDRSDLRYPWPEDYHYRRKPGGGFVLLPPLP